MVPYVQKGGNGKIIHCPPLHFVPLLVPAPVEPKNEVDIVVKQEIKEESEQQISDSTAGGDSKQELKPDVKSGTWAGASTEA